MPLCELQRLADQHVLAETVGMSQSSFHEHFKFVTETPPLQDPKGLHLIETQSLRPDVRRSVSEASFEVGYERPARFGHDNSRKFGCPPRRHLPQTV